MSQGNKGRPSKTSRRGNRPGSRPQRVAEVANTLDATKRAPFPGDEGNSVKTNKTERMTIFTGLLVFVGFGTLGLTTWQSFMMKQSSDAANQAAAISIAGQRAWVAPRKIAILNEPIIGGQFDVVVSYQNLGRDPATNVGTLGYFRIEEAEIFRLLNGGRDRLGKECTPVKRDWGKTLYPSDTFEEDFSERWHPDMEAIKSGTQTAFFTGCFHYDTLGERREGKFCFYWEHLPGKPMTEWPGNTAEMEMRQTKRRTCARRVA